MIILIVTHPLGNNYGGLLQAYALQHFLRSMGHDPWILNIPRDTLKIKALRFLRNLMFKLTGRFYVTEEEKGAISKYTSYFAQNYIIPQTPVLKSNREIRCFIKKHNIKALVVGSDQVWRPRYVNNIYHFFLDFSQSLHVKRLSYAASFGVDEWEFSLGQTVKCKKLLDKFDSISVREDSGIVLCKEFFGRDAQMVLDPTLLLDRKHYSELVIKEREAPVNGELFCYVLDKSEAKKELITNLSIQIGYRPCYCMPEEVDYSRMNRHNKDLFVYPPVTRWIRSVMDSKMVLTDSFHGCVFSILFNRPFWVLINNKRGSTRFKSLLRLFGLEERILSNKDIESMDWKSEIDWKKVNAILEQWREKSIVFLQECLSE